MKLYDWLDKKKKILGKKSVRIYTCGPSVYDYSHIGNFRAHLYEDVLVRYLKYRGIRVRRVMNITDVEDKAIKRANKLGITVWQLEKDKIRQFWKDYDALGMLRPDVVAMASSEIPAMIRLINRICKKGYCFREKDGIYFNVRKFKKYGKLLGKRMKYAGIKRKDDYAREEKYDFRLWKFRSRSDRRYSWDSPFGRGRPGWHIECSAIVMHHLGEQIDIHCGGWDNIFPHHENEIAQTESATGKRMSEFWLYCRHLTLNKRKMSKRTGNVLFVKDLKNEGILPKSLRSFLLSERYRSKLDFSKEEFKKRDVQCQEFREFYKSLKKIRRKGSGECGKKLAGKIILDFEKAMDDDLDTRKVFRNLFRASKTDLSKLSKNDAKEMVKAIEKIDNVLRIL